MESETATVTRWPLSRRSEFISRPGRYGICDDDDGRKCEFTLILNPAVVWRFIFSSLDFEDSAAEPFRRLRWAGRVARMGQSRNAYRVLGGMPDGKRPLGRPRRRWEDNIEMDLREVGYDYRDWINLAQDRDQWRAYPTGVKQPVSEPGVVPAEAVRFQW
ncbi:hypothetical protein ANN_13222 [Periplaneta americana]|uniref:Uncharacterized protein n=1 Tax=Periplaneta americana TaxID=6978 RepID=A0ABQ8TK70_PERAM|nr:hypothetical protein ANN_13222 [Periplaneta americana]